MDFTESLIEDNSSIKDMVNEVSAFEVGHAGSVAVSNALDFKAAQHIEFRMNHRNSKSKNTLGSDDLLEVTSCN